MYRLKYLLSIVFLTLGFSSGVVINEIHYNPSLDLGYEDVDYEFVELFNDTDNDIDITGWSLASNEVHYEFSHHILGSGEYALLCRNADAYDGCIDHHGGSLYNDGDQLWLLDAHHNVIDYVLYDDGQDNHDEFPPQADAEGPSIELINPSLAYGNDHSSDGSDWQASSQINGTPGYQNSDGGDLEPSNNIAFGAFCDSNVEILYNSNIDIAGFQFNLTGLTIGNTFGGAAEEADFSVSNSESTVIGFSFDGNTIPAGEGLLLMVNTNDIAGEQCIDNIIVSDQDGNLVQSSSGECTYLLLEEECTNCDDELACNFGADTSCEYPDDNFDCDGNCIVEEDCNGDCGGNAIVDDCGVCGGDNADLDCNGDCFGDATIDECGVCNGDGIADGECNCYGNVEDCNGDCYGNAYLDDCGVCSGGNTGHIPNSDQDCSGECFGDTIIDDCGECSGDGSSCIAYIGFGSLNTNSMEIIIDTPIDVAGFQMDITGVLLGEASGGLAADAGFTVSTGSLSTIIGFSFAGEFIPAGSSGVLTNIDYVVQNDVTCITNVILSDTEGNNLDTNVGDCILLELTTCDNPEACNFGFDGECQYPEANFDCDGNCIVEEDCNGDCGGDAIVDDCGICNGDASSCFNSYFDISIEPTGNNHLLVIENIIGLESGDEVGLFDMSGLISSEDCTDNYEELLVGAGVYDGSQMEIVGVGSLDFCDFPDGYQLSGWVEDNPITIKIYDASQDYEYVLNDINYESGGQWNEQFSTIMELDANIYGCTDLEAGNYDQYATVDDNSCVYIVTQQLDMDGVILNNISLNVQPGNPDVEALFANHDVMFIANQDGQFYVPENDVNTIGDWDLSKGYHVLLNGFDNQMLQVEGYPVDLGNTTIRLEPFRLNNISFPLHQPISAADLVEGLPVIFCTDDQGHYYIPGSGFNTIDESGGMLPGKGYQVLIAGSEALEFTYSEPSNDNLGRNLTVVGSSNNYEITRTGVSHPIVINQITGVVSEGDELVAYANGVPVGVIPVNIEGSTLLVAWKSLYEYDLDTDGYRDGDKIELRLFSQEYGQEFRVMTDFNVSTYGESPITTGSIQVLNELAVPAEFGLEQNYPNPFNPTTTIDINVATDSYILFNIYDINGRLVSTLADDNYDTGYHSFMWNGLDQYGNQVSAGIYFYSLQTKEMTLTKKMILMK